ncbi:MAG TPA: periplasmic heavy metal sensor [Terriglobales bacterium]|jgi:Spy/CpxP family protein refolding chaperone
MRIKSLLVISGLLLAVGAEAQTAPPTSSGPTWTQAPAAARQPGAPAAGKVFMYKHEMGKWWQNSDVAKKLQLSDGQISQLDQIFYDHRMKLIDYGATMEKQDLKLQSLLDADVPNEGEISSQVDQVLSARGRLEREFTMMNLDLRKVLSVEQWRQLKSMHGDMGMGDKMFFHKFVGPGSGPQMMPLPPGVPAMPPPAPGAAPDEMF